MNETTVNLQGHMVVDTSADVGSWTTPHLVREYAALRVTAVLLDNPTTAQLRALHTQLDRVVDALRSRGVLD